MLYTDKYLRPFVLFEHLSFDEYCLDIPVFHFRNEVPEDVVKNYEIVDKLLAFSYFEYKFVDEALSKAIHTFEMAMSIKYKELNPGDKQKLVFDFLIKALTKLNHFDTDLAVLEQVKQIRNHFSHPERHSFGGSFYWHKIDFISRLINEMHEDVNLRIERKEIVRSFVEHQKSLNLDRFLVLKNAGNDPTILFNLNLLWVNNKLEPRTFLFEYTPIFDLTCLSVANIRVPDTFGLKIINPVFDDKELVGTNFINGDAIRFSKVADVTELNEVFQKWKSEYDKITWSFMYEQSIQTYSSLILVPELQEFQKM